MNKERVQAAIDAMRQQNETPPISAVDIDFITVLIEEAAADMARAMLKELLTGDDFAKAVIRFRLAMRTPL